MAMKLLFPRDGDVLSESDGTVRDGKLYVQVRIDAPKGAGIVVNGVQAEENDRSWTAEIGLGQGANTIAVTDEQSGLEEKLTVYWLKDGIGKYRVSVDDNIWFLKDIAANSERYSSIFDNPYLRVYKDLHDTYGAKVHLNLFYETDGFDLSQMPDKFKPEWQAQADWLRLTFHARKEFPDKPYKHADAETVMRDCEAVTREIIRFAGEELLSPVTTIHWGEATKEGCQALRSFGFRMLSGYFRMANGETVVSYYLDQDQTEHLNKRDFWKDHSTDLVFSKIDMVLDKVSLDQIVPELERVKASRHEAGCIELMIHEQYFYPHYRGYQPDFREKLMTAVKWAADNGYEPSLLDECLKEL